MPMAKASNRGRPLKGEALRRPVSFKLDEELILRLHRTAHGSGLTVTAILEAGAEHVLKQLERKHNGGKPFPATPREGLK